MQIPHVTQDLLPFAPPAAATLIQQDNAQRPLIEPVTETHQAATKQSTSDHFTASEQADAPLLYNSQGQAEDKTAVKTEAKDAASAAETDEASTATHQKNAAGQDLTLEQQEELLQLQQRDQEVRTHEQQHASVGGQHTGSPSYDYATGPDGKQYVVEGSVSVNLSPVAGDPNATIEKMRQVKAAALAPAQPSSADKNAAAQADMHIAQATAELMQANKLDVDDQSLAAEGSTTAISGTTTSATTASATIDNSSTAPTKSATKIATETPTAKDGFGQMELRNQVIAGVYGQAAQAQSQQLLNLA